MSISPLTLGERIGVPASERDAIPSRRALEPWGVKLFFCAAVYLVVPLFDVPFWGLSLSTPVLMVLLLDAALRRGSAIIQGNFGWLLLGASIWFGQFLSLAANVFNGSLHDLGPSSFAWLLKYAFWIAVFLLVSHLVAFEDIGAPLTRILAGAVIGLGVLRVGEGLIVGALGNAQSVLLQQNNYGWAFSTFTPFAVWLAFAGPRRGRMLGLCGLLVVGVAIAINGSRASWVAVAAGAGLTLVGLLVWSPRHHVRIAVWSMVVVSVAVVAWIFAPDSWREPVERRWGTLERLERDKSYAVRLLMTEKAWALFEESPWFGIGVGRFREEFAAVDLPPVLRHRAADSYQRRSAHNAYMGLLAESGLLGAVPVAALLVTLCVAGVVQARRRALLGETWPIAVFAGFAGMCLHLLMLSGLTNTAAWFVFGVAAGVIGGVRTAHDMV